MTVLVTGGAGYIGAHLVADLIEDGESVVVIDDLRNGVQSAVPAEAELVVGDVGNRSLVRRILERHSCTTIFHLAASTDVTRSVERPLEVFANNNTVTLALLECAVECGVENFLFSSSAAVYGDAGFGQIGEDTPARPMSPYATSKHVGEMMLSHVANATSLRCAALRYFNVGGADVKGRIGQSGPESRHLIKVVCQTALGLRPFVEVFGDCFDTPDGTAVRDYIHIRDLTRVHLLALRHLRNGNDSLVMNCGSGRGHTVREVIACAEALSGRTLPVRYVAPRDGEVAALVADTTYLRSRLGWEHRVSELHDIVGSALEWERRLAANGVVARAFGARATALVAGGRRGLKGRPGGIR